MRAVSAVSLKRFDTIARAGGSVYDAMCLMGMARSLSTLLYLDLCVADDPAFARATPSFTYIILFQNGLDITVACCIHIGIRSHIAALAAHIWPVYGGLLTHRKAPP